MLATASRCRDGMPVVSITEKPKSRISSEQLKYSVLAEASRREQTLQEKILQPDTSRPKSSAAQGVSQ